MNYTIHLKKSSYEAIEKTPLFSFLQEKNNLANFSHGVHATLAYHKEKTPTVKLIIENTQVTPLPKIANNELCITTTEFKLTLLASKTILKKSNIIYIPKIEGSYDVERTWKIIQEKQDFSKIKKVYFVMEEWSKLVYAYRFVTSYGIAVEDITYGA